MAEVWKPNLQSQFFATSSFNLAHLASHGCRPVKSKPRRTQKYALAACNSSELTGVKTTSWPAQSVPPNVPVMATTCCDGIYIPLWLHFSGPTPCSTPFSFSCSSVLQNSAIFSAYLTKATGHEVRCIAALAMTLNSRSCNACTDRWETNDDVRNHHAPWSCVQTHTQKLANL